MVFAMRERKLNEIDVILVNIQAPGLVAFDKEIA